MIKKLKHGLAVNKAVQAVGIQTLTTLGKS